MKVKQDYVERTQPIKSEVMSPFGRLLLELTAVALIATIIAIAVIGFVSGG